MSRYSFLRRSRSTCRPPPGSYLQNPQRLLKPNTPLSIARKVVPSAPRFPTPLHHPANHLHHHRSRRHKLSSINDRIIESPSTPLQVVMQKRDNVGRGEVGGAGEERVGERDGAASIVGMCGGGGVRRYRGRNVGKGAEEDR